MLKGQHLPNKLDSGLASLKVPITCHPPTQGHSLSLRNSWSLLLLK